MNFDYSDEQQQLADSLQKYLASHYSFEQRKAILTSATGLNPTTLPPGTDGTSTAASTTATPTTTSTPTTTDTLLEGDSVLADKQAPVILSPSATGGRALNQTVKLVWAAKIPARYYEIHVASDSAFQSPISGSPFKVTAPATELSVALPAAVRYYWRVRTNYNSPGVWSNGYFDAMNSSVHVFCPQASATCDDAGQSGRP